MRTPLFTGSCPALITPFDAQGKINYQIFAEQIEYQITHGAGAVCVCGTTGEASTLTPEERKDAISFCVDCVAGRVPVIAGTGGNNTAAVISATKTAQDCGANGVLIVTPYYNKTSQRGLILHYESIVKEIDLPVILYNVPGRTGLSFTADTYAILAQNPQFNGVKEASGSLALVTQTMNLCGEDFYIWSGNDDQVVPMMALGAKGVITVAGNLIPDVMAQMSRLCLENDFRSASKLYLQYAQLIDLLFCEVNPIPLKYAMKLAGRDGGILRLPLCDISPENGKKVQIAMEQVGMRPTPC